VGTLDGQGALVTGGSRGIGRAIVKRLAADGAEVVFSYLQNEGAAREVVSEVAEDGGHAVAVQADQGSLDDLRRLTGQAGEHLDALDIVVINAAGCPVVLTALRRLGQPGDIAAVVAFLAGPDSGWISGQNLAADGGLLP
jgi:NAD(P)-dependent dehydrogenase (short-subunit alcohol dehydrogenase family)